jgi:flagellar motor switch protein FliG
MTVALNGAQKAAVVLAQLDQKRASKVLTSLSEAEVLQVMSAMATLPVLGPDEVREVQGEFVERAALAVQVAQGGVEVARALLRERLGAARAEEVLAQFMAGQRDQPMAKLASIDPQQIVSFIGDEHPQTIAVVLAHLPADNAAQVLGILGAPNNVEVARRIATMGRLSPDVVHAVADSLEKKLSTFFRNGTGSTADVGGLSAIVAILNQSERGAEKQILGSLDESDPELAEEIRNEMFVFDDVVQLDDRTLQRVLRNVPPKDLAVALKGVDQPIRDTFLRNMSGRAAQDLAEEIELLGPTRLSQVESAQQAVVKVVRELEAAGEIVLVRGGDDQFV